MASSTDGDDAPLRDLTRWFLTIIGVNSLDANLRKYSHGNTLVLCAQRSLELNQSPHSELGEDEYSSRCERHAVGLLEYESNLQPLGWLVSERRLVTQPEGTFSESSGYRPPWPLAYVIAYRRNRNSNISKQQRIK